MVKSNLINLFGFSPLKRRVHEILFLCLLVSMIPQPLLAILEGRKKSIKTEEIEWVYGENKPSRTIAFLEFENLTLDQREVYDSYRKSLPRIIAERIKNDKTIESPSNDFIPMEEKLNQGYLVKEISFTDAEKNKDLMDEVFQFGQVVSIHLITPTTNSLDNTTNFIVVTNVITNQTSLGEMIKTNIVTNQTAIDRQKLDFFSVLTNNRVAFFETDEIGKKYRFNIFKKDPQLYFDPHLLSPYEKYFVSNDIHFPSTRSGKLYYPIDRSKKKKFILMDKLYRLNDAPLGNILANEKIDYFIYGSFKVFRNKMELNLYVIHVYEKKITHIYRENFLSSAIREKAKLLDISIMSFLQNKEIVQDIRFTSQPPGGLLRLNDRFIGSLPQTLSHWIAGDYSYEVWMPNHTPKKAVSDNMLTENNIEIKESQTQTEFIFESDDKGVLDIGIKNGIPGDYYLNSKLVGKNSINYSEQLYPGEYFVSVTKSNYVTRNFKINVEPNTKTSLNFSIMEKEPKSDLEKIFTDYNLYTKIFGTLGFALGATSFGTFIHTLRLEDQKNSSQKRIEELTAAGLNYDDEIIKRNQFISDYNLYLRISLGLFSGGIVSLITMLIFHTLDVFDRHAPIETTLNHNGDVEIKYSKDF